jgi:hypothetical protein
MAYSSAAFSSMASSSLLRNPALPDPYSGLLFFAGVAAIAAALEVRRRTSMREGRAD